MSQLTNFVRGVATLTALVDRLTTSDVNHDDNTFQNLFKEIETVLFKARGTLVAEAEKLGQKLNQVDPVTGNKRYGDQSIQKLVQANEELNRCLPLLGEYAKAMEPRKLELENRLKDNETKVEKKDEPFVIVKYFEDSASLENPNPNFMKDISLEQLEELHNKADDARVRKMVEQEQLRRFAVKVNFIISLSFYYYIHVFTTFMLSLDQRNGSRFVDRVDRVCC